MFRRGVRLSLALLLSAGCLVGVGAASLRRAPDPTQVTMRSGTLWVVSNVVGEITRLDGIGAEVNARVSVGDAGERLSVRQHGADAFVVSQFDGQMSRVDGATLRSSPGRLLLSTSVRDSRIYVGATVVQFDPNSGQVAEADPQTLTPQSSALTVNADTRLVSTSDDVVWALDPHSGELRRFGAAEPRFRPRASGADGLTGVNGHPVLLNSRTGEAVIIDNQTGSPIDRLAADLTERDIVSGADDSGRMLVVRPARGTVASCRFGEKSCRAPVFLADGTAGLGAAVEAMDQIYVPDYDAGLVHVVSQAKATRVAVAQVFPANQRPENFELLVRDGIVFFNDPNSERAGVIRPDGTVLNIVKYNPKDLRPGNAMTASASGKPTPSNSPIPKVSRTGRPSGSPQAPRRSSTGAPESGSGPPVTAVRVSRIDFNPTVPEVGEVVTGTAVTAGAKAVDWQWTVRRPDGSTEVTSRAEKLSHTFTSVGVYEVTVLVATAGTSDTKTVQLTVVPFAPPLQCGDTVTVTSRLRGDLNCPGTGLIIGADDITIDLDGHTITGPGSTGSGIIDGWSAPSHRGFTIKNGTVRRFGAGVTFQGSQRVSIVNVKSVENGARKGRDDGPLVVLSASTIAIEGGVFSGGVFAATVDTSQDIEITGVTASGGMQFVQTRGVGIADSTFSGGDLGLSEVTDLTVEGCRFDKAGLSFFEASEWTIRNNEIGGTLALENNANNGKIIDNRFSGGETGILLQGGNHGPGTVFSKQIEITGNRFSGNGTAGIYFNMLAVQLPVQILIADNEFRNSGHAANGTRDENGSLVNDGIHINAPHGTDITLRGNHAFASADFGIEAIAGSVIDGHANTSSGAPNGCAGVICG